jgi:hypothetical protein
MKKLIWLFFLLIGFTILFACSCKSKIEIGKVNKLQLLGMDGGKLNCQAEIEIHNQSIFSYTIEAGELHAYAGNKDVGVVKLATPLHISGNSSQVYKVEFVVLIRDAEAGIFSLVSNLMGTKTDYKLKGNIVAKSFFIHRTLEIDKLIVSN